MSMLNRELKYIWLRKLLGFGRLEHNTGCGAVLTV